MNTLCYCSTGYTKIHMVRYRKRVVDHCMNAECHGILRVRNCNVIARECISWNVVVYVDVNQLSYNGNICVFRVLTISLQLRELYDYCVHAEFHSVNQHLCKCDVIAK